jgi:hypothetical protein
VGVSLAISKDLGGVRWGVFEVSRVGLLASRAFFALPRRSLGPAIIAGVTASESAVPIRATRATPCHCATTAIGIGGVECSASLTVKTVGCDPAAAVPSIVFSGRQASA